MPFYIDDPDAPGTNADVLVVQRRDPFRELAPVLMRGWMKRDVWTRREALLLLSGYDPQGTDWGGHTVVASHEPGYRMGYLDGSMEHQLRFHGVQHPRYQVNLEHLLALSEYAAGTSIDEKRSPSIWIAWAAGKDFSPYWLAWLQAPTESVPEGPDSPARTGGPVSPGRTGNPLPENRVSSMDNAATSSRQNDLGLLIDEVVAQLQNAGTRASVIPVMAQLVKLKGTGCCIVDADQAGHFVYWRNEDGDKRMLTKEALKGRLRRRKQSKDGSLDR